MSVELWMVEDTVESDLSAAAGGRLGWRMGSGEGLITGDSVAASLGGESGDTSDLIIIP